MSSNGNSNINLHNSIVLRLGRTQRFLPKRLSTSAKRGKTNAAFAVNNFM